MGQKAHARHGCPVCGAVMTKRDRGPAQAQLPPEYVCWNMDCLQFGTYQRMESRS